MSYVAFFLMLLMYSVNVCVEAKTLTVIEVDWIHVDETLNKFGHLPDFINIKLPVDPDKHVTIELHRKEDDYHNIPIILGGDDGHVVWKSHEDEKFHVYSDKVYSASFTVAINKTSIDMPKITYFGSFLHKGRMYSLRPGTKDHVHHEILQHFPVIIHNEIHVVVEDKPLDTTGHTGQDYFNGEL